MHPVTPPKLATPANLKQCPSRIEVDPSDLHVSAATVKTWVTQLRSHGWTDQDLDLQWLTRAKRGVTR
ncbi:MAG TPA: hypothetical protein VKE73_13710 [Myxococcota bacterium]|jgi:transposase|nr:hypothetical protein [Myxococcota bacterium]